MFYDLDLMNRFDKAALHAGCPVLSGVKWTATKWIHEVRYDNPKFKEATCEDDENTGGSRCKGWANAGECDKNPGFMIGSGISPGSCIASCCGGAGREVKTDLGTASAAVKRFCAVCGATSS